MTRLLRQIHYPRFDDLCRWPKTPPLAPLARGRYVSPDPVPNLDRLSLPHGLDR